MSIPEGTTDPTPDEVDVSGGAIALVADAAPAKVLPTGNSSSPSLTAQQLAIVNACRSPSSIPVHREILRVTAAAGTGKTTTLVSVGKKLRQLGHDDVSYVTSNKAAAADATRRFGPVDCRIIHSLTFHLFGVGTLESSNGLTDDYEL